MGLRTGPIQEGSQPGPRLDRKARARKDPKAPGGFKANAKPVRLLIVLSFGVLPPRLENLAVETYLICVGKSGGGSPGAGKFWAFLHDL